jgi:hypothetical protein
LIANEIVKSTNLKNNLLLSEGLSVEVIPLYHCFVLLPLDFIPPPHFFIPLPVTLLKHFDLEPVFRVARDEATPPPSSARMSQPSELSPSGSRLCHLAWNTYNIYYIRIYHDIAKSKDYNGTIDSSSMPLSPSASVQGHWVDLLLSPIDPLSMESQHFFTIFILEKQQKCRLEREQWCKPSRNGENSPKHMWPTVSRVDLGSKDWVLDGALRRPRSDSSQHHPAWPVVKC